MFTNYVSIQNFILLMILLTEVNKRGTERGQVPTPVKAATVDEQRT